MSFNVTMEGSIKFTDKKDFNKAVKFLIENEWMREDGFFFEGISTNVIESSQSSIDTKKQTIQIPRSQVYTNRFFGLVEGFIREYPSAKLNLAAAATASAYEGIVIKNNKLKKEDLSSFAKEEGIRFPKSISKLRELENKFVNHRI